MVKDVGNAPIKGQIRTEYGKRKRHEDDGKLRDGRVGEQPFHVFLGQIHHETVEHRDECHHNANPANDFRHVSGRENGAGENIDPHFDHRGCMQVSTDGRGGFHGTGQPHMKRDLCRFAPCRNHDAQKNNDLAGVVYILQGAE